MIDQYEKLALAIKISAEYHLNQLDKAGMPYVLHTLKVMHRVGTSDPELAQIAVLHDVIEDTKMTLKVLSLMGFSKRVTEALKLLTHVEDESYTEYITKIAKNKDAIVVKLADLTHNSDIRRMKGLTQKDFRRLRKYNRAYSMLKHKLEKFNVGSTPN